MTDPFKSDPAKQTKKIAKQFAKQVAQEPIEIAKDALKQVTGFQPEKQQVAPQSQIREVQTETSSLPGEIEQQKKNAQSQRLIQALENEVKEIIARKEAEKRRKEIIEEQQEAIDVEEKQKSPLIEPSSKKPRNIFGIFNRKPKSQDNLQAKRQQTRIERVMPPSG